MVVERQGNMECALCTMGALLDVPLAEVREVAQTVARARRALFYKNRILDEIAQQLDPSGRLRALLGLLPQVRETQTGGVVHLSNRLRKLPARGRGVIRLRFGGNRDTGHIAPWENGLIYDPDSPEQGCTLPDWRRANPHARVHYITKETN